MFGRQCGRTGNCQEIRIEFNHGPMAVEALSSHTETGFHVTDDLTPNRWSAPQNILTGPLENAASGRRSG